MKKITQDIIQGLQLNIQNHIRLWKSGKKKNSTDFTIAFFTKGTTVFGTKTQ
jgi:hypothetical protein